MPRTSNINLEGNILILENRRNQDLNPSFSRSETDKRSVILHQLAACTDAGNITTLSLSRRIKKASVCACKNNLRMQQTLKALDSKKGLVPLVCIPQLTTLALGSQTTSAAF
jgi:hypothetical protein